MGVRSGHLTTFWIIAGLGVPTMVSGVIGWSSVHVDFEGRTVWADTVYNTLLAFTGLTPENRWIGFARFAGLATTIYALLAVSVAFLGIQMARLRAAFRRGHSVVIGASEFAVEFAARNGRATVLDTAEALDRLPLRQRSVLLLPERMTATTGTGPVLGLAPREVIFGDADPVVNVERARLWLHGAALSRVRTTQLVLRIEDKSVARDLGLLSDALAKARLISRADLIARSLVTAMAPTAMAHLRGQPRVHVALVGLSSLNLSVAEEIALRCHHPALGDPMVTVVDRDAVAATARIRSERPDLFNPDFGADGFSLNVIQMEASASCAPEQAEKLLQIEQDTPPPGSLRADAARAASVARHVAVGLLAGRTARAAVLAEAWAGLGGAGPLGSDLRRMLTPDLPPDAMDDGLDAAWDRAGQRPVPDDDLARDAVVWFAVVASLLQHDIAPLRRIQIRIARLGFARDLASVAPPAADLALDPVPWLIDTARAGVDAVPGMALSSGDRCALGQRFGRDGPEARK